MAKLDFVAWPGFEGEPQSKTCRRENGQPSEDVLKTAILHDPDTMPVYTLYFVLAVSLGCFIWVIDSALDALFFYHRPFLDLFLFDVPPHEIYIRSLFIVCFLLFAGFASRMAAKQKRVERELFRTGVQLDQRVRERTADLSEANDQLRREIEERQRAEETLRHYAERLEILHELDQAILELRSPEEIAQRALVRIRKVVPFQWASIRALDSENRGFAPVAQTGLRGEALRLRDHLTIEDYKEIGETIREGKIYLAEDIHDMSIKPDLILALEAEGIRSFLSVPLAFRGKVLGILSLGAKTPAALTLEHVEIACEIAVSLAVATENSRLLCSLHEKRQQLRSLTARLVEVEEAERRELARELHDGIGQNMSALNLNLNIIAKMLPGEASEAVRARLVDSQKLLEESMVSIRELMSELRTPILDEHGLAAALHSHVAQVSERTAIPISTDIDESACRLLPSVETALYRIAQETLCNVARHSHATQTAVMLHSTPDGARLTVTDNGVGFTPGGVSLHGEGLPRLGLISIRERAEAMGGSVQIESSPGHGTCVIVDVPGMSNGESREGV